MWFIGVEVEQETIAPPPKKNPGSAPAMGAIPNHSILHPLPHPPPPHPSGDQGQYQERNFFEEFLTKMLISKGENTEKKFLKE